MSASGSTFRIVREPQGGSSHRSEFHPSQVEFRSSAAGMWLVNRNEPGDAGENVEKSGRGITASTIRYSRPACWRNIKLAVRPVLLQSPGIQLECFAPARCHGSSSKNIFG